MNCATILIATIMSITANAQQVIPLYDVIPNSKNAPNEETREVGKNYSLISKISVPTLTIFLPEKNIANGTAVVICPGGGYWVNADQHEGTDVAAKFTAKGVAAFVLKYRIPNEATMIDKEIGPLQDVLRAIKIVRDRATSFGVDKGRVGVLGFSAGGHLASSAATHYTMSVIDNKENTTLRPDFAILIYPVISFSDSVGHRGSRDQLIGQSPKADKIKLWSNELQITATTPPSFLVHAMDDDVVPVQNSLLYYDHLVKEKIPSELHVYQKGGHGFGLVNPSTDEQWIDRCFAWMKSNGWLKK
jgi:acetyl esterase/lipase